MSLPRAVSRMIASAIIAAGLALLVAGALLAAILAEGRAPTGKEAGFLFWAVAATSVAVLVAFPFRVWLSRFANRIVYKDKRAPGATIRNFSGHASRAVPLDELLLQAVE